MKLIFCSTLVYNIRDCLALNRLDLSDLSITSRMNNISLMIFPMLFLALYVDDFVVISSYLAEEDHTYINLMIVIVRKSVKHCLSSEVASSSLILKF